MTLHGVDRVIAKPRVRVLDVMKPRVPSHEL